MNYGIFFIIFLLVVLFKDKIPFFNSKNTITFVSGYWKIPGKFDNSKYSEWFKNTLAINEKYIFFCDKEDIDYIKPYRKNKTTVFIDYPLESFYSKNFIKNDWSDENNIVRNKYLGQVWNEKMYLVRLAKDLDKSPTEFYAWVDAGICIFREKEPPTKKIVLEDNTLPHDKLCYSYVKEKDHNVSGTFFIMHRSIIDKIVKLYYSYLTNCTKTCGSDQHIFTYMLNDYPELFYKMSEGYGENLNILYN
jgi:hypothetical protein